MFDTKRKLVGGVLLWNSPLLVVVGYSLFIILVH